MTRSALVVLVPEAEPLVGDVRARLDPVAALGVPPHVTLLFPFMLPSAVSPEVLGALQFLFASFPTFEASFTRVERWAEEAYLPPEPADPFVALIRRLAEAFPQYPPYGGRHAGIVPHLTVAQGSAAAAGQAAQEVTDSLTRLGPVRAWFTAATYLEESSGLWRTVRSFPFAQGLAA